MSKETTQTNAQEIEIPKFNPDRAPEEYDFGPDFIKLYVNESFLGGVCANITRCEDWKVPTAYIGFNPQDLSIVMGYNPEFMACLTSKQREWVIKHEIYHLCLQHILGRTNTNRKTRQIFNIAADLAVNSFLGEENMFEYALMPGKMPKNCKDSESGKLIQSFRVFESTEYYMEALRKFAEKKQQEKCPVCAAEKQKKQKGQPKQEPGQTSGQSGNPSDPDDKGEQGQNKGESKKSEHDHKDSNSGDQPQNGSDEKSDKGESSKKDKDHNDCGDHGDEDHNHEGHDHSDKESNGSPEEGNGPLCDKHNGNEDAEYTIGIGGPDGETMDGHPGWGELPEDIREIMNEKIKDMISEGVKRAQMKGSWGTVPSEMQGIIQRLLTCEIDWKSILRYFIGRARSIERDSTIKRINKKAPYIFPGVRRKTKAKLAFFIDQSGSMSDQDVQLAMSAAFSCSKEVEIDVYNFDTSVDEESHQVWKKGNHSEWRRTRTGGTNFDGVRDFVSKSENRGRWTGIAIVTDGYAPKMSQLLGVKVIWLITPNGTLEYVREGDLVVKMLEEKTAKVKR